MRTSIGSARRRSTRVAALLLLALGAFCSNAAASTTFDIKLALGQYKSASGDTAFTVCNVNAAQTTTPQEGYDDIALQGNVDCTTDNVKIQGSSTLSDANTGLPLAFGTSFTPTISPFSRSRATYRENEPARLKQYQATATLDLHAANSPSGWFAPQCTGQFTSKLSCTASVTFPTLVEDFQDQRGAFASTQEQIDAIFQYAETLAPTAQEQVQTAVDEAMTNVSKFLEDNVDTGGESDSGSAETIARRQGQCGPGTVDTECEAFRSLDSQPATPITTTDGLETPGSVPDVGTGGDASVPTPGEVISQAALVPTNRAQARLPGMGANLCTTSARVGQNLIRTVDGGFTVFVNWAAKENCPVPLFMTISSAVSSRPSGNKVATGTRDADIDREVRSQGGYIRMNAARGHRTLTIFSSKRAPAGFRWGPVPKSLDTNGIDQKRCVGYRSNVLACTFVRFYADGIVGR